MPDPMDHDCMKIQDALSGFLKVDTKKCGFLCSFFTYKRLEKGELLFKEGDQANFAALVISGALEVKKETEFPGRFFVLSIIPQGHVAGEFALLNRGGLMRSATVTAHENSELAIINKTSYDEFCMRFPIISSVFLRQILFDVCNRLKRTNKRLSMIF